MSRIQKPTPIQLQPATADSAPTPRSTPPVLGALDVEDETPPRSRVLRSEDVLDRLRDLVAAGELSTARRLTKEASQRFPENEEIERARRVLGTATATPNSFTQPSTAAEIAWLENPPAEARGKWVALVGNELVGMAKTLADLMQQIEAKKLPQLPVVQRLAS